MVVVTFRKSMAELLNKIWTIDEAQAKINDPNVQSWCEIEKGANWKVWSQINTLGFIIWPRHTIFAKTKIDYGNKCYLVAHSVKYPGIKVNTRTHVENIIHLLVYEFEENANGTTSVWCIVQVDPKGLIPTWLIDMYSTNMINMFNRWKQ